MKQISVCTLFITVLLNLISFGNIAYAQDSALPYQKSVNWNFLTKELKSKLITSMPDNVFVQDLNNSAFTLLDFEQDFSTENQGSIVSTYSILLTLYFKGSGHAMKEISTQKFIIQASILELFNIQDLKFHVDELKKKSIQFDFYNDECSWRDFKSSRFVLKINKISNYSKIFDSIE